MCVICSAAKKRHMKRQEVEQAIASNSAGFFGFTVKNGQRCTIRTLNSTEFMKFFDEVGDDDPWVMHARIPSRGKTTLDNVHGWEEDGIIFCHNMTMYMLDEMMKRAKWGDLTDSEFFFRKIFMPFYRGCGKDAYKDGKFCEDLDNVIKYFAGAQNKFLFIMPDNNIITYGQWVDEPDRLENGKHAFIASNQSYKVFNRVFPSYSNKTMQTWDNGDDDDFSYGVAASVAANTTIPSDLQSQQFLNFISEANKWLRTKKDPARIALRDLIANNLIDYRNDTVDPYSIDKYGPGDALKDYLPSILSEDSWSLIQVHLRKIGRSVLSERVNESLKEFLDDYTYTISRKLANWTTFKRKFDAKSTEDLLQERYDDFLEEWDLFTNVALIGVDFNAPILDKLICATTPPQLDPKKKKWTIKQIPSSTLLMHHMNTKLDDRAVIRDSIIALLHHAQKEPV